MAEIFGKKSKSGEKGLYLSRFYAILYIIVKSRGGLSAFQNIEVKKKRKARTRLFGQYEYEMPKNLKK